jgi:lysophospholipase L1-like esterase
MAIRSRLVFPAELNSVFNDTLYVPDAVLINLGTNDFGHDGGPAWEAAFTQTYVDFLHNLTEWHANPALPFFCGVGPITHSYTNAVNNAIAAAKSQYGINAVYVNYTTELDGA